MADYERDLTDIIDILCDFGREDYAGSLLAIKNEVVEMQAQLHRALDANENLQIKLLDALSELDFKRMKQKVEESIGELAATLAQRLSEEGLDRARLCEFAAVQGLAIRDGEAYVDECNDIWRSLPDHLQNQINAISEERDRDEEET